VLLKKTGDNHKITFLIIQLIKRGQQRKSMDYIRKMVKSLIAGYVITLLMLGLLTYFMRKFILDEKAVDNVWMFVEKVASNRAESVIVKIIPEKKDETKKAN
jgi:fucose 4-O-acetylase-like acetyltransferase